jgi:hypothetical protein
MSGLSGRGRDSSDHDGHRGLANLGKGDQVLHDGIGELPLLLISLPR